MKIYFVEDENGMYYSEDRSRRFRKLTGEEAYSFLSSGIGKTKRFMKINDSEDGGDDVYFEVPKRAKKNSGNMSVVINILPIANGIPLLRFTALRKSTRIGKKLWWMIPSISRKKS